MDKKKADSIVREFGTALYKGIVHPYVEPSVDFAVGLEAFLDEADKRAQAQSNVDVGGCVGDEGEKRS